MTSASRMALTALFVLAPFVASPATAQTASIGTNPAGSVFYVVAGKGVSDAILEGVLRAAWEHGEKLAPIHVIFKEWTRDRMASADVTIPYHPTAIRFFKERGVWTAAHDQAQQRLLGAQK